MKRYVAHINKAERAEHGISVDSMIAQLWAYDCHSIVYVHDEQAIYFTPQYTDKVAGVRVCRWCARVEEVQPNAEPNPQQAQ